MLSGLITNPAVTLDPDHLLGDSPPVIGQGRALAAVNEAPLALATGRQVVSGIMWADAVFKAKWVIHGGVLLLWPP